MKSPLHPLLPALAALLILPLSTFADMEVVDGIEWSFSVTDGEATVLSAAEGASGAISIPSTLGGCPVTRIGNCAFCFCSELTSITIPNNVTSIGDHAFFGCSGLTSITVPYAISTEVDRWELPEGCQIAYGERMPLTLVADTMLSSVRAGFLYSQRLVVAGGLRPYSFERTDNAGNLSWIRIDSGTYGGWLYGCPEPSDVGTHSFTFRVTDAEGTSVEKTFTITVRSGIEWTPKLGLFRIDPGAVTNFAGIISELCGDSFSFEWGVEVFCCDDYCAWWQSIDHSKVESFTFDSSVYGEGRYRISGYAENGTESTSMGWTVLVAPKKTLAFAMDETLPTAKAERSYEQRPIVVGGEEPYTVEIVDRDSWPDWLASDFIEHWWMVGSVGPELYGYPEDTDVGTHSFTLRVTDAEGTSIERTFTVAVEPNSPPVIDSWTPTARRFRIDPGATTNFFVVASDSDGDGLSFYWDLYKRTANDSTWLYGGYGAESFVFDSTDYGEGRYEMNVVVSDGVAPCFQSWTFTVGPKTPLAFETSAELPSAKAGWSYWQEVEISGGEEPYTVEIVDPDAWPDWLDSDSVGYDYPILRGWPGVDEAGPHSFTLRVTDAEGTSISRLFTLVVEANSPPVIESWTPERERFRMDPGATTNFTVIASDPDGDDIFFYWRIYKLIESGPTRIDEAYGSETFAFASANYGEGSYIVECEVSDGGFSLWEDRYVLVAEKTPLAIVTDGSLPSARTGQYYQQKLTISGGEYPYTNNAVLPGWLMLDGEHLYGCPDFRYDDIVGTHSFTFRVTDVEGTSVEKTFTLEVEAWTMFTPEPVPHAWLDEYYTDLVSWHDYEDCGYSGASNGVNQVWQCYVSGLDPTNATNRLLATIGFDEEGKPAIGWSPELSEDEAAKRTYTILGKTSLTNEDWTPVAPGTEANYNFFSVSVEMK